MRFDLTDEEWALLEPLMPESRKTARVDDRKIMNAILSAGTGRARCRRNRIGLPHGRAGS
jgi:transposase